MTDTKEQEKAYIVALLRERAGYEAMGFADRVKEVDAELRRLGHEAKPPAKRAEKRPAAPGEKRGEAKK